ncbi:MAG: hypothetical protein QW051_03515, partial [Candidatus Aenigmatarchaeota archaeon]
MSAKPQRGSSGTIPSGKGLNALLNFIKNNPPEGKYWNSCEWKEELTENIPNWENIIKDKNSWNKI